ncbi:MAG TPA: ATP-binding protein [Syntrophorhabdaceae bacterium]|jgi:light-regulated signal transduction histidine kinase (bacteriophytochrome)
MKTVSAINKAHGKISDGVTTRERGEGLGIGLPIVYRIAKEHHGGFDIKSAVGEGRKVNIYLPLAECDREKDRGNRSGLILNDGDSRRIV